MSQEISGNNKRIARNTLTLYIRTFVTMIVGLYTGRVMLETFGVDNYSGGGIVGMSSLITGTMSAAISRYITYALGRGDKVQLKVMFSLLLMCKLVWH